MGVEAFEPELKYKRDLMISSTYTYKIRCKNFSGRDK